MRFCPGCVVTITSILTLGACSGDPKQTTPTTAGGANSAATSASGGARNSAAGGSGGNGASNPASGGTIAASSSSSASGGSSSTEATNLGGSSVGSSAIGGNAANGGSSSSGSKAVGGTSSSVTSSAATAGRSSNGGTGPTSSTGAQTTGGQARGGQSAGGQSSTSSSGGQATGGQATGGATSVGACKFPTAHNGNGSLTWYTLSQGTDLVNCSFPTHKSSETVDYVLNSGQYFAAMNTQEYATAAACGACVEVTRDNNKKVTVMVADQCPVGSNPKCKAGHIDLAKPAFSQLASGSEGYLGTGNGGDVGTISWKYVPCPITGNVKVHLKDPSNQNWNEFMVANHRIPIAKFEAEVNGTWTAGTRKEYNFFNVNGGNVTFPLNVRITDLNGSVITFAVAAGTAVQDTGAQFPSCQ